MLWADRAVGTVLRLELPDEPGSPLRVRVRREGDGLDYGWVRLDELSHLVAVIAGPDEGDEDDFASRAR